MVTIISIMVQMDPIKNELCIAVQIDPTTQMKNGKNYNHRFR